jgi:ribose-phosphate pyrophosphokinase
VSLIHAPSLADSITTTPEFRFSVHTTLVRAAKAAKARGAKEVIACVAHGLFMPGAETALSDFAIERIIATDSVPPFRLPPGPVRTKLEVISTASLFAEAIRRMHQGEAVGDLLAYQA